VGSTPTGAQTGSDYVRAALPSSKLEVMEGQSHIATITAPYLLDPSLLALQRALGAAGEADIRWSSK
jgi:hypothetical protein